MKSTQIGDNNIALHNTNNEHIQEAHLSWYNLPFTIVFYVKLYPAGHGGHLVFLIHTKMYILYNNHSMIRPFLYNLDPIKFIVSDMKFSIYFKICPVVAVILDF